MLVGLIADVHSNAVALKAVLCAFDDIGVEKILHAGDIVVITHIRMRPSNYLRKKR